jgi:hypothetical protein
VTNNSVEQVTIGSLDDDVYGPLAGDDDCKVGTVLDPGESCEFSFSESVGPEPGATTDTVTACADDNEDNTACDDDEATVTVTDVLPTMTVTKTAEPTSVPAAGGSVTFTVKVTNTSVEPVTITSLDDDVYGPLAGDDDCKVGTVLDPGESCEFSFTEQVSGAGDHTDVVTVCADDNEDNSTCPTDDATVSGVADQVLANEIEPEQLARTGPQEIGRATVLGVSLAMIGLLFLLIGNRLGRPTPALARVAPVAVRGRPQHMAPSKSRVLGTIVVAAVAAHFVRRSRH